MCGAAAIGAVAGVGQALAGYQAEVAGVNYRNKAKLKNFERQNVQYLTDAMLDNAQYKQDQIQEDTEQDKIYQNMINQWRQNDRELDQIFAKGSFKMEQAIREMHQNDYAGDKAQWDSWDMYEKVRYAPIHGHAPVAPLLEAKPSPLGAIFGAVGSAAGAFE